MTENKYSMFFGSWYNLENGSGVYAIVNSLNNKKYIGSTSNLRKRFRQHYAALIRNNHDNYHLQNAVNKYGIDKFYFMILERQVDKFTIDGKYVCTYASIMDAARSVGNCKNSRVGIKKCCQQKQRTAYGYIWKLKEDNYDK